MLTAEGMPRQAAPQTRPKKAPRARKTTATRWAVIRQPLTSDAPHFYHADFGTPFARDLGAQWATVTYRRACGCEWTAELEFVPTEDDAAREQLERLARTYAGLPCSECYRLPEWSDYRASIQTLIERMAETP